MMAGWMKYSSKKYHKRISKIARDANFAVLSVCPSGHICRTGELYGGRVLQVLKTLYDKDIVEEKAFLDWADEKEHAEEHERAFLSKASKFITWLREAEEEDEDESEEDSD